MASDEARRLAKQEEDVDFILQYLDLTHRIDQLEEKYERIGLERKEGYQRKMSKIVKRLQALRKCKIALCR